MKEILKQGYTVPEYGTNDAEAIQNAIAKALELGLNKTVIPRYNARQDSLEWLVSEAVLLPSHFCLEIDNAELHFAEKGCFAVQPKETASDIFILGRGNACLIRDAGGKSPLIQARFACRLQIKNLLLQDCFAGGIALQGVEQSVVSDITFVKRGIKRQENERTIIGGVVLGSGCRNITVENIFGTVMAPAVELNPYFPSFDEESIPVVCDILVRNVRTDCFMHEIVSIKNGDDGYVARITVDGVIDASDPCMPYRGKAAVSVGNAPFGTVSAELGQTRNITIRNVVTRGASAVELSHAAMDMTISDITILPEGSVAIDSSVGLKYNNIYLCNVKFDPRKEGSYPFALQKGEVYVSLPKLLEEDFYPYRAVCNMKDTTGVNFKINGVYADEMDNLLRILGKNRVDVYDADILNIMYDDCVSDDCIMET